MAARHYGLEMTPEEAAAVAQCYGGEGRAQLAVRDLLEHLNRAAADLRMLRFAGDEDD